MNDEAEIVALTQADQARIRMAVSWAVDTLDERSPNKYTVGDVLSLAMHYLGYALFEARDEDGIEPGEPTSEWQFALQHLKHSLGRLRHPPVPSQYSLSLHVAARIAALADEIAGREVLIKRMRHLQRISRGSTRG